MRRRALVAAALAAAIAVTAAARAYVRSRSANTDVPLYWSESCAFLTPDSSFTPDVAGGGALAAVEASAATWSSTGCSYFVLKVDPAKAGGVAKLETPVGVNFIVFRQDRWCPASASEACYDPNATALTTLFYEDTPGGHENGRILDADVELNNVDFAFTVDGTTPPTAGVRPVADIQNTLTHELGHLVGLDHTCYDGWNPCESSGRCKAIDIACTTEEDCIPLDDQGQHIPRCLAPGLPASVVDATMYNFEQPLETSKRTLSPDDVNGVCAIYPPAKDPGACARVDTAGAKGCAVAGAATAGPPALLGLLSALALARRRRRASGARPRPPAPAG